MACAKISTSNELNCVCVLFPILNHTMNVQEYIFPLILNACAKVIKSGITN